MNMPRISQQAQMTMFKTVIRADLGRLYTPKREI